jgi:glycosyltransferase involved in cell wall biosynthesis/uncharacterized SAM-binding protein YcdF (DUF218 family)
MLNRHDIICISSIDWDFIWQGHQEIMATLARAGNRVLFIENTGVRSPTLKDLPRLRHRVRNWSRATKGFRQEGERLFIYSPVILPFPYSRLARWINRHLLLRAIQRWMRTVKFGRPIVWTFLPTPLARDLIQGLNPLITVYYCIDDFASSSRQASRIAASERALFREADVVFVTSEKLRRRASQDNRQVFLFPFGVSFERFQQVRDMDDQAPSELRALPRPVVGYVGGLHQWVDQELVAQAARRLPQASFVLIGPSQTDVSRLASCPNIHLLGAKAHEELPRYIKGFDVGIVPYRLSEYTMNVYPTKLNEYLAMGIPVVTTDLPEIRRFNAEHGGVVTVAPDAAAFAEAIAHSRNGSADIVARRIDVARRNSWCSRIEQMSELLETELAARRARTERWEESLRLVYRRARRRLVSGLAAAASVYLLLFYTPFVWWCAQPLRIVEPPRRADVIVVFAGGVGESGQPGQGYEERVAWAVELYRQGLAPRLVFSSGYTYAFHEPDVMKAVAVALGVLPEAILVETRSTTTHQNVVFTNQLLEAHGWDDALMVSSPYHMRRARLVWHRVAPAKRVTCVPVPDSRFYRHGRDARGRRTWRQADVAQIRAILHEYLGILYYKLRGWL